MTTPQSTASRKRVSTTITACVELEAADAIVTELLKEKQKLNKWLELRLQRELIQQIAELFSKKPVLAANADTIMIEISVSQTVKGYQVSDAPNAAR